VPLFGIAAAPSLDRSGLSLEAVDASIGAAGHAQFFSQCPPNQALSLSVAPPSPMWRKLAHRDSVARILHYAAIDTGQLGSDIQ
jgi:hypothetical protein